MPLSRQIWLSKHAANNCGTNSSLHKRGKNHTDKCPRCHVHRETSFHVLDCLALPSLPLWKTNLIQLQNDLGDINTDPHIANALLYGIYSFKQLPIPTYIAPPHPTVHKAYEQQTAIGWNNLFFGLASSEWAAGQDNCYKTMGSKRTGRLWLQRCLRLLLQIHFNMDHRNQTVHDDPEKEQEIRKEVAIGDVNLTASDLPLLRTPQAQLLSRSQQHQQLWLTQVRAARKQGKAQKRKMQPNFVKSEHK